LNGVGERFKRMHKEQGIRGLFLENIKEVREGVCQFVEDYHADWGPEKLEFKTPVEARRKHVLRQVAQRQPLSRNPGAVQRLGRLYFRALRASTRAGERSSSHAPPPDPEADD
jgi:hypothetical protein